MPVNKLFFCFTFFLFLAFSNKSLAQRTDSTTVKTDSTSKKNILKLDTAIRKYNPKVATFRSAVLPGWGQAYNKKYWKIPIVYAALGTSAAIFFYNLNTYKKLRQAVIYRSDTIPSNDALIDPEFRDLSTEAIRTYRNSYRQNVDYSALAFIVIWGLNVVDATVDAHLKAFDVSGDLSLRIKPSYNPYLNTGGLTLVFSFKDKHAKSLPSLP